MTAPIDFLLLGPLEARHRYRRQTLRLGSIKHRMLLAKLLLHPNQVVSTDELIDSVWGEEPPATVRQSLQNHVAALRKAIESGGARAAPPRVLLTREPGYLLRVEADQLDLHRFQRLSEEGRRAFAAGDRAGAAARLREALSLWRGPVLADVVAASGVAWPELVGVDELRTAALEARIEADLALGHHQELVGELEALVRQYPLRERLHGQLMLALYRCGRQAEALAAYRAARETLVDELGIEPSTGLQRLEQAILAQDAALDLLAPAPPTGEAPGEAAPAGHGLDSGGGPVLPPSAERKLVTVLFCDVDEPAAEVDQDERDPEDVSSMLAGHLERVRAEVEGFGGTVQYAVGGTTMATFGVPRTREDDPERAVRAALAIREALLPGRDDDGAAGRGVQLRVAVTTGEALVNLGNGAAHAGPGQVAGDPVTTCARLQQAAPPGTVLVSEATERATERVVSYGPGSLLAFGGRARPLVVYSALEPRNRTSLDLSRTASAPLVGRKPELAALRAAFDRARAGGTPQLVTLVGPPGIGKSRLVAELGSAVEAEEELVSWRVGRSLPYGESMAFWALAEVVKAEAGIRESDPAERAGRKLAQAARHALADDPDAVAWVTRHLRLLVGAGNEEPADGERQETIAAWRRFLHGLASRRPLVLVLEDLHWADDALLDFVETLAGQAGAGRSGQVRLLVVATARPKLLERRPKWRSAGPGSRTTVELGPLSRADTTRLLDALLERHGVPATVGAGLLARVGGNPLFAEEYVRMLRDRGPRGGDRTGEPGASAPGDREATALPQPAGRPPADGPGSSRPLVPARPDQELPLPETVHAIIAARLDALPGEEKAVLQDAAVLGRVGWLGGLAAIGRRDRKRVEACLARLEAREFVRRVSRSSLAGEREYEFSHILVHDVAYGQIPRADRIDKHRAAATWIEALDADRVDRRGGNRAADRAELLAHHYQRALGFTRAAGRNDPELTGRAALAFRDAGDRAAALGADGSAANYYLQALELWPADSPERPELEFRAGKARCYAEGGGEELLARAREGLLAAGRRARAAEAEMLLGQLAYVRGQRERAGHLERARALVADAPSSPSKAAVLEGCMMHLVVSDRHGEAVDVGREALAIARELGLRELEASVLGTSAVARIAGGDPAGIADLQRCVSICDELGSARVIQWNISLAFMHATLGDLPSCSEARTAAWRAAERFGSVRWMRWVEIERVAEDYWSGRWNRALTVADELAGDAERGARHYLESDARIWRGRIRLARGDLDGALGDAARALDLARESGDPQNLNPALAFAARVQLAAGRWHDATELVDGLLGSVAHEVLRPDLGVDLGIDLVELGRPAEVLDAALPSRWLDAARSFVAGDPGRAAALYAEIGSRPDEAYAHLAAARRLSADGRGEEARAEAEAALGFYREVGASAYVEEGERLCLVGA
ncbi:MAG TPA: BTAD domain-containing putative transcriptional regulator [Actinomycetota bacterium]|jgi:DNA-binding SARP family transcriptional activator